LEVPAQDAQSKAALYTRRLGLSPLASSNLQSRLPRLGCSRTLSRRLAKVADTDRAISSDSVTLPGIFPGPCCKCAESSACSSHVTPTVVVKHTASTNNVSPLWKPHFLPDFERLKGPKAIQEHISTQTFEMSKNSNMAAAKLHFPGHC
jgi:hypothetical protein